MKSGAWFGKLKDLDHDFSSERVRHEGVVDDIARGLVGAAAVGRNEHLVHEIVGVRRAERDQGSGHGWVAITLDRDAVACRNVSFCQLFLCLSRACLGKYSVLV